MSLFPSVLSHSMSCPSHLISGTDNDKAVELGNFAQFKGCVFDGNRANNIGTGAAFAVATAVLFESRELVKPVELIDW